jgi:hypothetical protein
MSEARSFTAMVKRYGPGCKATISGFGAGCAGSLRERVRSNVSTTHPEGLLMRPKISAPSTCSASRVPSMSWSVDPALTRWANVRRTYGAPEKETASLRRGRVRHGGDGIRGRRRSFLSDSHASEMSFTEPISGRTVSYYRHHLLTVHMRTAEVA